MVKYLHLKKLKLHIILHLFDFYFSGVTLNIPLVTLDTLVHLFRDILVC